MTTSMKTAVLHEVSAPLRVVRAIRPTPETGEVLARVVAAGTNPLDTKIDAGEAAYARHPAPAILGLDMAGTVEALRPDVTHFRTDDEVYGMVGGVGGDPGTLAEYVSADEQLFAAKPPHLILAAALGGGRQ